MKPKLKKFTEVAKAHGGNKTEIAKTFGVSRMTVNRWCNDDPDFHAVIENERKSMFDDCLVAGYRLALGVPILDDEGNLKGWKEKPDQKMVQYLLSTLGRDEGFGERLDLTTNGKDITTDKTVDELKAEMDELMAIINGG